MNEKPLYLTIKRSSDYLIFLGPKLTSKPFEETLVAHWDKSQQTKGRIVFALEEVQWASLTEVLILTMWALHLRKLGKNVAVCLPFCGILREGTDNERNAARRKAVCSFLSRWQFPVRLDEQEIEIYGSNQSYVLWTERDDPHYCKVLPIKCFSKENVQDISDLKLESTVYHILGEHSCLDPFESRAFADIIFHEIAKNIFDHASDKEQIPGLISIGMIKKNIWSEDEYGAWDAFYFKNLGEKSYLQIVIGYHGKGIYNTLFSAYKNDSHLNKQRYYKNGIRCDEEPYVLRYSLEKLSTRTDKSRLLFPDIPRGLAWVYDIVREYRGFLSIRSGSTRLGISFLPGHKDNFQFNRNLADFGGTILQIILPEYKPSEILSYQLSSEPFHEKRPNLHLLSIAEHWTGRDDSGDAYKELLEILDKTIRPLGENDLVFIDFSGISWDKNYLCEFIRKIMYLQGEILIICFNVNLDHLKLLNEVDHLFLSKDGPIKDTDMKITPFIDIKGEVHFLGYREEYEKSLLHELFEVDSTDLSRLKDTTELEKIGKFIQKNRHIIRRGGEHLQIRASLKSCSDLLTEVVKNQINKVFNNPPNGITIKHTGLFHLQSGLYTTKYIQLQHLFQTDNWAKKLAYALLTKIHIQIGRVSNVDFVFGCTASAFPLIECIAEGLSFEPDEDRLCIETYIDSLNHPDIEEIPEGKNVLIVTDVISTGGLIERMALAVIKRKAMPLAIATIVDTRETFESEIEVNGKKISVFALYHEYIYKDNQLTNLIEKYKLAPPHKIIEIDPLTATPCYEISKPSPPVIEPKDFFSAIINTFAVINRHVVTGGTGGTHFCFYVDTKEIFQNDQISSDLIHKIIDFLKKDLSNEIPGNLTILYPWGSNAAYATHSFKSKIKERLGIGEINVRSIFRSKSKRGWRFGIPDKNYESVIKNRTVVIWDDGSNSGDTLSQLIDYTCSFKPNKVFVYILISRFELFYRNFFQRVHSYGEKIPIDIKFITSLDIPTYKPNNCPCCKKLEDIETELIKPFANLESVINHLEREKTRLKEVRLKNIRKDFKLQKYDSLSELSKESEPFRKELSDLISMRESIAKLESLLPTEDDRNTLKAKISDTESLKMLCRIIRDEYDIWGKITSQCPRLEKDIVNLCVDTMIGRFGTPDSFDLIAIEILFSKRKYERLIKNLDAIILRIRHSKEIMNSFIYYVIKFLDDDKIVETLEKCRDICEKNRSNETAEECIARIQISKATQWARLNRSKNLRSKGLLKDTILSLEDLYNQDPHKSAFEWWNKLMVTSQNAGCESWSVRYKWWKEEINPLMQDFVKNIETLQPILLNITTPKKSYLLTVSRDNFIDDLIALDEKLHYRAIPLITTFTVYSIFLLQKIAIYSVMVVKGITLLHYLCMENIDMLATKKYYEEFQSIVNSLYEMIISKESLLAKNIKEFPTDLSHEINYILNFLKEEIEKKEIKLNVQEIQSEVKIQFHKDLFRKVFREFVLNMCKHCEKNVNAELTIVNNKETVEVKLIHPGVLKHDVPFGTGEEMIKELVRAHEGEFILPHKIEEHKIESKIIVRRW